MLCSNHWFLPLLFTLMQPKDASWLPLTSGQVILPILQPAIITILFTPTPVSASQNGWKKS